MKNQPSATNGINKNVQREEPNVLGCRKDPKINLAYYKEKNYDKTNNSRPTKLSQSNYWL